MIVGRVVRFPPAFRDHVAMPNDHEAVDAVDSFVKCVKKLLQLRGGNALGLGRRAGQGLGGVSPHGDRHEEKPKRVSELHRPSVCPNRHRASSDSSCRGRWRGGTDLCGAPSGSKIGG